MLQGWGDAKMRCCQLAAGRLSVAGGTGRACRASKQQLHYPGLADNI